MVTFSILIALNFNYKKGVISINYVLFENMKIVNERQFKSKNDIIQLIDIYNEPRYHIEIKLIDVEGTIEYKVTVYNQLK